MVKDFSMQKENLKLNKLNIPMEVNKLVPLPEDYLDLISMCSSNNKYLKEQNYSLFCSFELKTSLIKFIVLNS